MYSLFGFIFGESYWALHSWLIRLLLKLRGIHVGKNFRIYGLPYLKILGKAENIVIKNNVCIWGNIDLRNRDNGKIIIEDGVYIDDNCRFLSAQNATMRIGVNTRIGRSCIFNGGADLDIGEKCLFASMVYVNTSTHNISKKDNIIDQGFSHAPTIIENDVWVGGHAVINMGVTIAKGSIIGANAVVTKDTLPFSINTGVPSKASGFRE
jgi:acetyltransferase-like isoleucine patch superfamily enzyme